MATYGAKALTRIAAASQSGFGTAASIGTATGEILFNELRGEPDPAKLALVLKDLAENASLEDLSLDLPMTAKDIESMVNAIEFDWQTLEGDDYKPQSGSANKPFSDTTTFVLGAVRQHIPIPLANTMLAEFEASSKVCGTKNPEIVLRHFIARLQAAPADTVAAAVLPEERAPEKIGKKKAKAKKEAAS